MLNEADNVNLDKDSNLSGINFFNNKDSFNSNKNKDIIQSLAETRNLIIQSKNSNSNLTSIYALDNKNSDINYPNIDSYKSSLNENKAIIYNNSNNSSNGHKTEDNLSLKKPTNNSNLVNSNFLTKENFLFEFNLIKKEILYLKANNETNFQSTKQEIKILNNKLFNNNSEQNIIENRYSEDGTDNKLLDFKEEKIEDLNYRILNENNNYGKLKKILPDNKLLEFKNLEKLINKRFEERFLKIEKNIKYLQESNLNSNEEESIEQEEDKSILLNGDDNKYDTEIYLNKKSRDSLKIAKEDLNLNKNLDLNYMKEGNKESNNLLRNSLNNDQFKGRASLKKNMDLFVVEINKNKHSIKILENSIYENKQEINKLNEKLNEIKKNEEVIFSEKSDYNNFNLEEQFLVLNKKVKELDLNLKKMLFNFEEELVNNNIKKDEINGNVINTVNTINSSKSFKEQLILTASQVKIHNDKIDKLSNKFDQLNNDILQKLKKDLASKIFKCLFICNIYIDDSEKIFAEFRFDLKRTIISIDEQLRGKVDYMSLDEYERKLDGKMQNEFTKKIDKLEMRKNNREINKKVT